MPPHLQKFVPSSNELCLANQLLEMTTCSWNGTDCLGVGTAICIFEQIGISIKQFRDIWLIADKDGSGKLTKKQLAVFIRLTGWIQAGEELDERLLEQEGPLPKIQGILDVVTAKIAHSIPPITAYDVAKMKEAFLRHNPINGFLQKHTIMTAYMALSPDLSVEALFRVIQLIDDKSGFFNFKSFAIGLHIVRSLESALIPDIPSSVPPEHPQILDGTFGSGEGLLGNITSGPTTTVVLPAQVDSDIHDFMENIKSTQHFSVTRTLDFLSKYHISPVEMANIRRQFDLESGLRLSPTRLARVEQLIRRLVAKQLSKFASQALPQVQPCSFQTPAEELPPPQSTTQITSGLSNHSAPSAAKTGLSFNSTDAHRTILQQPPSYDLSTNPHDDILGRLREEVDRLTSQLAAVVIDQRWANAWPTTDFESLQQENVQLKLQHQMLQHELATKKETSREADKAMDSIKLDLLEQQAIAKEYQETTITAKNEAERLWSTVEMQSRQITILLELVADMKTTITELNIRPESTDLRLRFLRATVRESEAATTKALGESLELRQIVNAQELEISRQVRQRLEDPPNEQAVSESDKDIQSLRSDHEDLKIQMENMQRLLEHLMVSKTQLGTVDDEETLVQPRKLLDHGDKRKPNHNDFPRVFPNSPKHQSLLTDSFCADAPNMKIDPFYLPQRDSTYSSLARTPHDIQEATGFERDDTSQGVLQLEEDLHLFRLHVQRKGYIGIEMVERFISKYDLDAYALDEIGRLVGLDASVKRINQAVNSIRQVLIGSRNHDHNSLSAILSRSSSSTSTSSNAKLSDPVQGHTFKSSRNELQPSTRFCAPVRTSMLRRAQRLGSLPQSTISSVNPSTLSTINSSLKSTMAVCNGVV